MKNFKNLFFVLFVTLVALSSCKKYEDGPLISFRSKADRAANEWIVTGYQVNGNNDDANLKSYTAGDTIQLVFIMTRNNDYTFNMQYTKEYASTKPEGHQLLTYPKPDAPKVYADLQNAFKANCLFVKNMKNGGKWAFVRGYKTIRFGTNGNPDMAYDENNTAGFFEADILMLKNKKMKLRFLDPANNNAEHVITFEPRNPEIIK